MEVKWRGVDARFDASTTYLGDYRQWSREQPPIARSQSSCEPPNMPFERLSTCKNKKKKKKISMFMFIFTVEFSLGHYIPHEGGLQW
jgi:hypothetical protein